MLTAAAIVLAAPLALAQPKTPPKQPAMDPANPITSSLRGNYERVKKFIEGAAEEMPAADYAWRPTPEVRSFGELIGHVADASFMFCGAAKKEAKPGHGKIEKTATTKDALKKALAEAFAYCDAVYASTTDATLTSPISLFGNDKMLKFQALDINVAHDNEHYGNIVTYLRIKKIVPPSSKNM
jgi:uncharacterized damage-inducible protein DinB